MAEIQVDIASDRPVRRRRVEIVERKGLGHPDTICDSVMEAASVALCRAYLQAAGRILHHNLDKGLLIAGETTPRPGGGTVHAPMRIVFGDRAVQEWRGTRIPVGEIVESVAVEWFRRHIRFVDPSKHLVFQNEIRPGSPELVDLFARKVLTANDTSAAVGFAPLSETEQIVLETERFLNSPECKQAFPAVGEDVKVMGVRQEQDLTLTIAIAFLDWSIPSPRAYFELKAAVAEAVLDHLRSQLHEIQHLDIRINTLDDPSRGVGGMYLTVLGTSAEGADGGEVGRGNRVNGLISLNRPMTMEAAAGKNPVSHVGKIYNVLSHQLARHIHAQLDAVTDVAVWLTSRIGYPLDEPWSVSVELHLAPGFTLGDVQRPIREIIHTELADIATLTDRLSRGEFAVC
jgi:S-adenosylmethionine synthetase